jgi:hypothetical protein
MSLIHHLTTLHWAMGTVGLLLESFCSPSGVQPEFTRSSPGVHQECTRSSLGVQPEFTRSPTGVQLEHIRSPTGVHQESNRSPTGAHQESNWSASVVQLESSRSSPEVLTYSWGTWVWNHQNKMPSLGFEPCITIWSCDATNTSIITTQPWQLKYVTQLEPHIAHVTIL